MKYKKIGYICSKNINAKPMIEEIKKNIGDIRNAAHDPDIDLLIVMGGDGFMIKTIHDFLDKNIPIYGINCGNFGFLLNEFSAKELYNNINNAFPLNPILLTAEIILLNGDKRTANALNEAYLMRSSHKAIEIKITVNDEIKLQKIVGDGIIVSTPIGSSAYNSSAGGPILPLNSNLITMTAINSFRPKKFSSVILPDESIVSLEIISPEERPVVAVVDSCDFETVKKITIQKNQNQCVTLLFDSDKNLTKKIIDEQFFFN